MVRRPDCRSGDPGSILGAVASYASVCLAARAADCKSVTRETSVVRVYPGAFIKGVLAHSGEHLFCKQEAAGSKPAGSIADSTSVHLIYAGGSSFGRALIKADPVRDLYRNSSGLRSHRFESDPPALGH